MDRPGSNRTWVACQSKQSVEDDDTVLMTIVSESVMNWSRFSNYKRLIKVVVYCLGFRSKQRGSVTALKKQKFDVYILQTTQCESFAELFNKLEDNTGENLKQNLAKLFPFIDSDNTLRLNGRLSKATVSEDLEDPIPLSAKHPAVVLLMRELHEENYHEGTEYVRSKVHQRFWVIGLRNALLSIKSKCSRCKKLAVQPIHPQMAALRKKRVQDNVYPFKTAEVDYSGPFEVAVLRRPVKHWCFLFTCLVTGAVHIEVVNGLDTHAYTMEITKFMARRGKPRQIVFLSGSETPGRQFRYFFCRSFTFFSPWSHLRPWKHKVSAVLVIPSHFPPKQPTGLLPSWPHRQFSICRRSVLIEVLRFKLPASEAKI